MEKTKSILEYIKHIRAMAKTGLSYSENPYDVERYEEMKEMSDQLLNELGDMSLEDLQYQFGKLDEYPTPKVDVRGLVIRDDKILMIREKVDQKWAIPGGWADIGHTPAENIVKEIKEESGFEVIVSRLLAVWDKKMHDHPAEVHYVYKLCFLCEIIGGELNPGHETLGAEFFALDNLPELSLPRVNEDQLHRMFRLAKEGGLEWD